VIWAFHIHLNPFFVKEFYDPQGGLPDPGRRWQDTIIIPPASADGQTPGHVVIRHRFPEIVDKFVIHCHILGHEDRGMMQVVEVVAKAEDCSAAICE
jgi:FtsP/CotA-like multicopper oxidase with cupredoxin domain